MSRHHLAWIAILAAVFGSSTLLSQTAQALPQGNWVGSATCTVKTTGPGGYSDQQTHKWNIIAGSVKSMGAYTHYNYEWTVTGGGGNSVNTWQINSSSKKGYFQTHVDPNGKLHFEQVQSGGDLRGILVTPKSGGPTFPENIHETAFATIIVPATKVHYLQGQSKPIKVNGAVGFQQPAGSTTTKVCSWKFRLI
jgi:hypothetical protein